MSLRTDLPGAPSATRPAARCSTTGRPPEGRGLAGAPRAGPPPCRCSSRGSPSARRRGRPSDRLPALERPPPARSSASWPAAPARLDASSTFSVALRAPRRLKSWNTKAKCVARKWGRIRSGAVARSTPSTTIEPDVGRSIAPRIKSRAVLPLPDGPMIRSTSPRSGSRLSSRPHPPSSGPGLMGRRGSALTSP